ncbi:MAG: GNAT family N-acetyltransferase [Gammaproteobacteria bacterium]|nr:GNAT family N-acetyltransferase [Gammaproteobacteria bacterium]
MNQSFVIKDAQPLDVCNMSVLAKILTKKFILPDIEPKARPAFLEMLSPEAFMRNLTADFYYKVANKDQELIGFIGIKNKNHLYHLFVREDMQKQGVAHALWNAMLEIYIEQEKQKTFTVNASLNAKGFYEKLGFIAQAETLNRNGVRFVPMLLDVSKS